MKLSQQRQRRKVTRACTRPNPMAWAWARERKRNYREHRQLKPGLTILDSGVHSGYDVQNASKCFYCAQVSRRATPATPHPTSCTQL
jgi:hypothetical protein